MGFLHCIFCRGRGCLACDAERRKYEAAKTERLKNWTPPDEQRVSLAKAIMQQLNLGNAEDVSEERMDAMIRLPEPIATIRSDHEGDMALAKQFLSAQALIDIANATDGDPQAFREQFLQRAEAYRLEQRKQDEKHERT